MGGSPFRVVRLSAAGARLLDLWLAGEPAATSQEADKLRLRLIRAGIVHPLLPPRDELPSVAFVVPVYNDAAGLEALLRAIRRDHATEQIIVVDDASTTAAAIADVAERHAAELIRHGVNQGPAAARNTGWQHATSSVHSPGEFTLDVEVIVFVDADVVPHAGAVRTMLAHFDDAAVAAVTPRVRAAAGRNVVATYEANNSPLDMGTDAAIVYPGTRISYVPSAMLAVRADVLEQADGFDESMRYGEDVDMIWRIVSDGRTVRFEPRAVAQHRNRSSLAAFARQRFVYGSSAAPLAARHGDKVAPLQLPAATVATTMAMLFGGRIVRMAGLAAAIAGVLPLASKLTGKVDAPPKEAARLAVMTHGYALQGLAAASTRSWAPLLLLVPRARRALTAALVLPALIDWLRTRPATDPLTHTAMRALDHGSYCAGVWSGVLRSRSIAALLPHIRMSTRHDD